MRLRLMAGAATLALFLAAGCSKANEDNPASPRTYDSEESPAVRYEPGEAAAPGIVPTAAPGVAFNYHYGFRLPDAAISGAQEIHASVCEKLGLLRCRITGMTYELDDHDRVNGTLEISIDPLLARAFGRDAIAVVQKQDGKLRFARITGEDQNPALEEAARREGSAGDNIAKLEADLAKAKTEKERTQLREQIQQMRADIQSAQNLAADSNAKIKRTPMTFDYAGGSVSGRGFAGENPATEAWYLFVDSLATMIGFLLKAIAIVLPWLVVLVAIVALLRTRLFAPFRRWWKAGPDRGEPEQ